jgi:hypothetical protein
MNNLENNVQTESYQNELKNKCQKTFTENKNDKIKDKSESFVSPLTNTNMTTDSTMTTEQNILINEKNNVNNIDEPNCIDDNIHEKNCTLLTCENFTYDSLFTSAENNIIKCFNSIQNCEILKNDKYIDNITIYKSTKNDNNINVSLKSHFRLIDNNYQIPEDIIKFVEVQSTNFNIGENRNSEQSNEKQILNSNLQFTRAISEV